MSQNLNQVHFTIFFKGRGYWDMQILKEALQIILTATLHLENYQFIHLSINYLFSCESQIFSSLTFSISLCFPFLEWACSLDGHLLGILGLLGSMIGVKQHQDCHGNNFKMSQREMRLRPIINQKELVLLLQSHHQLLYLRSLPGPGTHYWEEVPSFIGVEPEPFEIGDHLIEASGKLHLLDKLLAFLYSRQVDCSHFLL